MASRETPYLFVPLHERVLGQVRVSLELVKGGLDLA